MGAPNTELKKRVIMKVNFKGDGIYLLVENPDPKQAINRSDIIRVIAENGVNEPDINAINKILENKTETMLEVKISNSIMINPIADENVDITITPNKMQAHARFVPPLGKGKNLTAEEIITKLKNAGVVFGIREDIIARLAQNKNYSKAYIIAIGKEAVQGVDGYIKFNFDISEASYKPKILPDGKADFRNLDIFRLGMKDQILCQAIDPVEGSDGMNVMGSVVVHVKAKKTPPIPKGKNVIVDAGNQILRAETDGQIVYAASKISILPVLEINGDVGLGTGNIDFNGSVLIKGNILNGSRVIATGNIEIAGVVEGAYIQAGGDMNCLSGITGLDKAELYISGNLTTLYIRNCKNVEVVGSIFSNAIMHSNVKAYGNIDVSVGKGLIAGGKVSSMEFVEAKIIGSRMAISTEIEVGVMKESIDEYNANLLEFNNKKAEYAKVGQVIGALIATSKKEPLPQDKKDLLAKYIRVQDEIRESLQYFQGTLETLAATLKRSDGHVKILEVMHSGVKVTIGNGALIIKNDIFYSRLYNDKGRVVLGSM